MLLKNLAVWRCGFLPAGGRFFCQKADFPPLSEKPHNRGQVIIEYVLLLVVSTAMALVLINFARISPPGESLIFQYWEKLLMVIGEDLST